MCSSDLQERHLNGVERPACFRFGAVRLRVTAYLVANAPKNDPVSAVETKLIEHGMLDTVDGPGFDLTLLDQPVAHFLER